MRSACAAVVIATLCACAAAEAIPSEGSEGGAGSSGSGGSGGSGGTATDSGWPETGSDGGAGVSGECTALGPWQQSAPFADADRVSHPLPSFGAGGYYYVHTMTDGGGDRILYSALQNPDGSLGAWQVASSDHGGGPHGFTAVVTGDVPFHFRNGHIARYPLDGSGKMTGDVELLEASPDSAFSGHRYVWDSALVAHVSGASWVIHLGGFSFTSYAYARTLHRSSVPVQSSFANMGVDHPAGRPGRAAFFAPAGANQGFVFSAETAGSELWRAELSSSGSLAAWQDAGALPAGTDNQRGDWFVIDATLFVVRGAKVFGAKIGSDGTLEAFVEQPELPAAQVDMSWGDGHLEGSAHAVLGDFVYLTGQKTVFYAPVLRQVACP